MEELLLVAVQPAGRLDVQAQQPADRQEDLADLLQVELVAEAAERDELVLGERVLDRVASSAQAARSSSM